MTLINLDDEQKRADGEVCPIVESIRIVGSTWKLIIIRYLLDGPKGFNELLRAIHGLNSKTLSRTLKQLQQDGLVERRVVALQPFSVEYRLTEKGQALQPVIQALRKWGEEWALGR